MGSDNEYASDPECTELWSKIQLCMIIPLSEKEKKNSKLTNLLISHVVKVSLYVR